MKTELPSGTVTFLFTDIEGSTRLWEIVPEKMKIALPRHHTILRETIESNDGVAFQIIVDAFCAAFSTAPSAVSAALDAQQNLQAEPWDLPYPIRVRLRGSRSQSLGRGGGPFCRCAQGTRTCAP